MYSFTINKGHSYVVRLSLCSDFLQACSFCITFERPLLNDTLVRSTRAVCHSARSAGEISEVICHAIAGSRMG